MWIWHQRLVELAATPGSEEALRRHAAAVCHPETEVVLRGMPAGSLVGTSPAEMACHAALTTLLAHVLQVEQERFDAVALAIRLWVGLWEAHTLVDIPVGGYGEAAMHLACQLGHRFAIMPSTPTYVTSSKSRRCSAGCAIGWHRSR